jgi:Tol biopolymer transport system component
VDANSSGPAWSSDGSKITFTSGRALDGGNAANTNGSTSGTNNIWVMNPDGSEAIPLTRITAHAFTLTGGWRP